MTRGGLGMTASVEASGLLAGIFTDGDLRRALERGIDVHTTRLADVMTRDAQSIGADALAVEAAEIMERRRITQILVVEDRTTLVGALNAHDLMRARVI